MVFKLIFIGYFSKNICKPTKFQKLLFALKSKYPGRDYCDFVFAGRFSVVT